MSGYVDVNVRVLDNQGGGNFRTFMVRHEQGEYMGRTFFTTDPKTIAHEAAVEMRTGNSVRFVSREVPGYRTGEIRLSDIRFSCPHCGDATTFPTYLKGVVGEELDLGIIKQSVEVCFGDN